MQDLRSLTVDTKDKPHVVMRGMTRHVVNGAYEDKVDDHYLPVTGYDDMSTIDLNRKQLGWAVVGHGHLLDLLDPLTGRPRADMVRFQNELNGLIHNPEAKELEDYKAQVRADTEAKFRAEYEAKIAAAAKRADDAEKAKDDAVKAKDDAVKAKDEAKADESAKGSKK